LKFKTTNNNIDVDMNINLNSDNIIIESTDITEIDFIQLNANTFSLILNGKSYYVSVSKQATDYEVNVDHTSYIIKVKDKCDDLLKKIGKDKKNKGKLGDIHALIPGLISKLFVFEGENVKMGQKLIILEAMKMENEIASPIDGIIKKIYVNSGDKVDKGSLIMEISN
jgi:biotin carboxyl carrier protein